MSNAAKIKITPLEPPSAFGYNVQSISMAPELGGAMLKMGFSTNQGEIEIRCTFDWARNLASRITRVVEEYEAANREQGITPFQAKE